MDSNRANRHRLGVILFCLIALLTAREDWDFRTPHPISPPIPRNTAPRRALELTSIPPTRPLLFDPDRNPMHGSLLRPLCPSNGSADLAACDFISEQTPWEIAALYQPEPGSAINPDMFPQALEFIPEAKLPVKEETIARELLQHVAEVQYPIAIANDPVGWWREPHQKCSTPVSFERNGEEYCSLGSEPEKIPEPGSLALVLIGAAAVAVKCFPRG